MRNTSLGVSSELQSLVMSMLAEDPTSRPSAEEVNQQVAQLWSVSPTDKAAAEATSLNGGTMHQHASYCGKQIPLSPALDIPTICPRKTST